MADCRHLYARQWSFARPWTRPVWVCQRCGHRTRRYNWLDHRMTRPIWPGMSVALPGYNTTRHPQESP